MPSITEARPFSAFLSCSQLAATSAAVAAVGVAEHVGVAADQLVVDAPGHVGQGERALLGGEGGVEDDLEEQVAQLLLQVVEAGARLGVEVVEGLEHLVGLLQQVAARACGGSARGPTGTRPAGGARPRRTPPPRRPPGRPARGTYSEVRWSGSTTRSRSSQATVVIASSGRPRRWSTVTGGTPAAVSAGVAQRQLHVGQDVAGVALGDQQRPPLPRRLDVEPVAVDQAHARRPAGRRRAAPRPGRRTTGRAAPRPRPGRRPRSSSTVCSATAGEPGTA